MADIHDLMRVTGAGRQAVTNAIERGDLPGYRVGAGRKFWIPDAALAAVEQGTWVPVSRVPTEHIKTPFVRSFDWSKEAPSPEG